MGNIYLKDQNFKSGIDLAMLLCQRLLFSNTRKTRAKVVHVCNHLNMKLRLHTCILDYYVAAENRAGSV